MYLRTPVSFFWEPSYACNLECKHCYTNSHKQARVNLTWEDAKCFLNRMKDNGLLSYAIGGGEPLLLPFLTDMIRYSNDIGLMPSITTNGTLITPGKAAALKNAGLSIAQVSIDGLEKTHDLIRGQGSFKKMITGTRNLIDVGIPVRFGVTVNKLNYSEIPSIIKLAKETGVEVVAFFRYMPTSLRGDGLELDMYDMKDVAETLIECDKTSVKLAKEDMKKFYLMFTPLSFFTFLLRSSDVNNLKCTAGIGKFNLRADGNITPCSHLPMVVGNAFTENELEVWRRMEQVTKDTQIIPAECETCKFAYQCRGGCKGISYIKNGNMTTKDPACFYELIYGERGI